MTGTRIGLGSLSQDRLLEDAATGIHDLMQDGTSGFLLRRRAGHV